jgi:hypothetical protein
MMTTKKSLKTFLLVISFFLLTGGSDIEKIYASTSWNSIVLGQPCRLVPDAFTVVPDPQESGGLEFEVNLGRSHSRSGSGTDLDFPTTTPNVWKCQDLKARAAIDGIVSVSRDIDYGNCSVNTDPNDGVIEPTNTMIAISNGAIKVEYHHVDLDALIQDDNGNFIKGADLHGHRVEMGQVISKIGSKGCAQGAHIHLQVKRNNVKVRYDATPFDWVVAHCVPPISSDWVIRGNCTVTHKVVARHNIRVENGGKLNIVGKGAVKFNFKANRIDIMPSGKITVGAGARIEQL